MKKKYEILKDTEKYFFGHKLYRIKALRDFSDVKKGDIGGYVESEKNLSQEGDCWIYDNAIACDYSIVCDNAKVKTYATACGNSIVSGNAVVKDCAVVCGNSIVSGNSVVKEFDKVYGNTVVCGDIKLD